MSVRTPMQVVAGSLGSGKTTLLRHLLRQELGRVALIVNEFGELGIDGQVLAGEHFRLIELPGGCVCCSLAGEFAQAVEELIDTVGPETILVETTGVAEADALVIDIEERLPRVRLEAVVVVVDADACCRFPQLGYAERAQIEVADLLLINKTDLVDAAQRAQVKERLRQVNPHAALVETCFGQMDPRLLGAPRPARLPGAAGDHGHVREFESFSWTAGRELRRERFAEAVESWPPQVYRAKGFVRLDGELWLFNYVAGRWQLEPAPQGRPGLVWIGPGVEEHAPAIICRLEDCGREF